MSFLLAQYKNEWKDTKIYNIRVNKKEFHKLEQPTNLVFKYFIECKEEKTVKPLCIVLPQMTGYIKYFKNRGKNMFFVIKDDDMLDKCNEIWARSKRH